MAASATEGGTTSLASSPPLWGRRQTRTSVPRNSNPAAVLADCTAAWASASKSRLDCAKAPKAASPATRASVERIACCFMTSPRWLFPESGIRVRAYVGPQRVDLVLAEHAFPRRHGFLSVPHGGEEAGALALAQPPQIE